MYILAWRVLWLTMVNRKSPELPAKLDFAGMEIKLFKYLVPLKDESRRKTVGIFLLRLARLEGYLNRTSDTPPGNIVLWRDMTLLADNHIGYCLAKDCRELKLYSTLTDNLNKVYRNRNDAN